MELTATFNILKENHACKSGYEKLAKNLGGVRKYGKDKPIPLWRILESNGLDDLLWCANKTQQPEEADVIFRLMAADFAESVLHLFEKQYPDDIRSRLSIEAARDFANGKITADAAWTARAAARDARTAAWTAAWDAKAAAWTAAWDAAWAEKEKQYHIAMKWLKAA